MTPERYSQVKRLFQMVLEQEPQNRATYLNAACGGDRELYQQVRDLLKADFSSKQFLEKPAVSPISKVLEEAAADLQETTPTRVGPYAIQRLLGTGGMGAVYLASRADQSFTKQVAIKVIRKGVENDKLLERFRRERQIVASLDHPNIARLLDGGATEDGRPYIVMEYVEGVPLDTYCDTHRLTTRQRLRLFLQVCEAVQYAHQNLIVHRDIKPGNILVHANGTVKLLDFGIAKLINPEGGTGVSDKTATSMRLMTPQYASPEQVRGDAVTTASDVYLLGIVLYELLTGHRPYDVRDDATLEVIRAFAHGEPPKPSDAIFRIKEPYNPDGTRRPGKNAFTISQTRDGTPAALVKSLKGDLDAILLKSLRRNPGERYQSAAQLADDIRNHLEMMPVSARPQAPGYRIGRFLKRNTALATGIAGALALILTVAVAAIWQASIARTERSRAAVQFAGVRKMSNALMFDAQDALAPLAGTTPVRRLLITRAREYLQDLSHDASADPALRREIAAGFLRIGNLQGNPSYLHIGDHSGAIQSYDAAQKILEDLLKKNPRDAEIGDDLASVLSAMAKLQIQERKYPSAIALLKRAIEFRDRANKNAVRRSDDRYALALALAGTGAADEARIVANTANQIAASPGSTLSEEEQARHHLQFAEALAAVGDTELARGHHREAVTLAERWAAASTSDDNRRRFLGDCVEAFASFEHGLNATAAAAPLAARTLQIRRELVSENPGHLSDRRDMARALLKTGALPEAIESLQQLRQIDPGHPVLRTAYLEALREAARRSSAAGKNEGAVAYARQGLRAAAEWLRQEPASIQAIHWHALSKLELAHGLARLGDREGSVRSAKEVLQDLAAYANKDVPLLHRHTALAQWTLAQTLTDGAAAARQPSLWRDAEAELQRARQLFQGLEKSNLLIGDDRAIPRFIADYIDRCRAGAAQLGGSVH